MIEIVPSVVAYNLNELEEKVRVLEEFSSWAHLDVADGHFTRDVTWQEASDLQTIEGKIKLEVHLMVADPELIIKEWQQVADRIIIHAESTEVLSEVIEATQSYPSMFGVALKLETPVSVIEYLLPKLRLIHLMSIKTIGHSGEPFDGAVLEKIKLIKKLAPSVTISVDGGINEKNAKQLQTAGADRLVVGSAIWASPDPAKSFTKLNNALNA